VKIENVDKAISEALRFVKAARAYKERLKIEPTIIYGAREGGSMRRASLDLSRALADLRNR